MSELENDLKVADELHENGEAQKVYDKLIKYKDLQNAEVEAIGKGLQNISHDWFRKEKSIYIWSSWTC